LNTPVRPLLAALFGLAVLAFVPFFFEGRVLWSQDIGRVYYPVATLLRQVLLTLDPSPLLWNTNLGAGFPLVADGVSTPFYPIHWPLLILLPPTRALTGALFLGYLGSALATAAFARTLGLSRSAAIVAGQAYAWCGFAVGHSVHVNVVAGLPFLPLSLLFLERARKGAAIRNATLAGVAWGLLCLGGHPQVALMAAVLGLAYGLLRLWPCAATMPGLARPLGLIALFLLVGAGLSAVYYFPMAELAGQSVRPEGGLTRAQAAAYSLPFPHLVTAVSPFFFHGAKAGGYWGAWNPAEMAFYVGLPTATMAGAALWLRPREPLVRFLAATGLVAFLLALGDATPLHGWVHALPVFRSLRAPARHVLLLDFALAVLAALGLDALRAAPVATARRATTVVGGVALVACGLPWLEPLWRGQLAGDGWQDADWATTSPLLLGYKWLLPPFWLALTALWLRSKPQAIVSAWPLVGVALVAADLASFVVTSFGQHWVRPEVVTRPDPAHSLAASAPPGRAYLVSGPEPWRSASDLPLALGFRSLNAYVSLPLARHAAYMRAFWLSDQTAGGLLDAAAVAHVVDSWRRPLDPRSEIAGVEFSPRHFLVALGHSVGERQVRLDLAGVDADRLELVTTLQGGARIAQGTEVAVVTLEAEPPALPLSFVVRAGHETAERLPDERTAHARPEPRLQAWSLIDHSSEGAFYLARFAWAEARRWRALEIEYVAPTGRLLVFGGSLRVGETRVALSPFMDARFRRVREEKEAVLYENRGAPPRAFAVHRIVRADGPADAVQKVASGDPRLDEVVVVEDQAAPTPTGTGPSTVAIVSEEPTGVELHAEMKGSGYVVLADASYPGWQATVDGRSTTVYTANGLFRTVFVPDGRHRVRFDYRPKALHRGLAVTLVTALIALLLVLVPERRRALRG
jgi:Bacterial membrane protein YfhO